VSTDSLSIFVLDIRFLVQLDFPEVARSPSARWRRNRALDSMSALNSVNVRTRSGSKELTSDYRATTHMAPSIFTSEN
jgi:hypothetical protein